MTELYEDLYEKSCALEHDQTMRIQELKRTVSDLEFRIVDLQKQLMVSKRAIIARPESNGSIKENLEDLASSGDGLDASVLEVQELTQKIKRSLKIVSKPPATRNLTQTIQVPLPELTITPTTINKDSKPATNSTPTIKQEETLQPSLISSGQKPQTVFSQKLFSQLGSVESNSRSSPPPPPPLSTKPDHKILTENTTQKPSHQTSIATTPPKQTSETLTKSKPQTVDLKTAAPHKESSSLLGSKNPSVGGAKCEGIEPSNIKKEGSFESDLLNIMNSFGF
ncbi:UNVERIFIED_CONTAM: hypothetical protein HDU68_002068 [Siphonaria sp. JEL0065]|nr:hypothetical protein HDU68_002068 [Siphonaria sp. JEL0065]